LPNRINTAVLELAHRHKMSLQETQNAQQHGVSLTMMDMIMAMKLILEVPGMRSCSDAAQLGALTTFYVHCSEQAWAGNDSQLKKLPPSPLLSLSLGLPLSLSLSLALSTQQMTKLTVPHSLHFTLNIIRSNKIIVLGRIIIVEYRKESCG
jgi:hypothetical protein